MLKFLALLAIVTIVQCDSSCSKGPSYWCQTVDTANECGAFRHCMQTVWTKKHSLMNKNLVSANSVECSTCVKCLYSDIRRCPQLRSYKDEIAVLFEANLPSASICRLINQCEPTHQKEPTIPEVSTRCNSENVCENLDMAVRCSMVPHCMTQWKSSTVRHQLKKTGQDLSNEEKTCGFCIFLMTKYQEFIAQNTTETEVMDYLNSGCRLLPTAELSQKCLDQVSSHLPELINFLRDNADPGVICRVIQLCHDKILEEKKFDLSQVKIKVVNEDQAIIKTPLQPKMESTELVKKMTKTNGMGCEMCNLIINAAKYLVKNDVDNKKVLMFIEQNLCKKLGKYSETCIEYVSSEGEKIIELIEGEIEPSILCGEIGLCMQTQLSIRENPFDLRIRNPSSCTQCLSTFKHVKETPASHANTLSYIKEDFCMKSGDMKYLCTSTMDAYSDVILSIIDQDINSNQICQMFEVCGVSKKEELVKPKTEAISIVKNHNNCVICQFVMKLLDQYIYKDATEEEIQAGLEKVCSVAFPAVYKQECRELVDTYTKTIIFLIFKKIQPEYICETIGVCQQSLNIQNFLEHHDNSDRILIGSDEKFINKLSKNTESDNSHSECVLCEFAVNLLSRLIQKNSTEEQVFDSLKKVCNKEMPSNLRTECNTLVDQYGPQMITLIINDLDAGTVCKTIKLCVPTHHRKLLGAEKLYQKLPSVHLKKTDVNLINLKPAKPIHTVSKDLKIFDEQKNKESMGCTLCIYTAQLADNFLKKNKTENEIEEELKLVCNYFPTKLSSECFAFVNEYGPYVIKLIATDLDPQSVCQELSLCGQNRKKTVFDMLDHQMSSNKLYKN